MTKKKAGPKTVPFEMVLEARRLDAKLVTRLQASAKALRKAGVKADLVLCSPRPLPGFCGRHLPCPVDASSQAALALVAKGSAARTLLFWPDGTAIQPAVVRALAKASASFDWVQAPRGKVPELAVVVEKCLGLGMPLDLGAPCAVNGTVLRSAAEPFGPGDSFLAARILRTALAGGADLGLLPQGAGMVATLEALGINRSRLARVFERRLIGFAFGGMALGFGLRFSGSILGLALFGSGILVTGYYFGKAE
jgi:hypothetical protein